MRNAANEINSFCILDTAYNYQEHLDILLIICFSIVVFNKKN
jgi:hypothetical protein